MKFGYKDLDVWNRSVDFELKVIELIETIDGDYVVCGRLWGYYGYQSYYDSYLMKLNNSGDSLWLKQFAGRESAEAHAVKEIMEGGYIISGMTNGPGKYRYDVFIVKTDTSGNMLCRAALNNEDFGVKARAIDQLNDGNYICAGEWGPSSIIKFDQWPSYRCGDAKFRLYNKCL